MPCQSVHVLEHVLSVKWCIWSNLATKTINWEYQKKLAVKLRHQMCSAVHFGFCGRLPKIFLIWVARNYTTKLIQLWLDGHPSFRSRLLHILLNQFIVMLGKSSVANWNITIRILMQYHKSKVIILILREHMTQLWHTVWLFLFISLEW